MSKGNRWLQSQKGLEVADASSFSELEDAFFAATGGLVAAHGTTEGLSKGLGLGTVVAIEERPTVPRPISDEVPENGISEVLSPPISDEYDASLFDVSEGDSDADDDDDASDETDDALSAEGIAFSTEAPNLAEADGPGNIDTGLSVSENRDSDAPDRGDQVGGEGEQGLSMAAAGEAGEDPGRGDGVERSHKKSGESSPSAEAAGAGAARVRVTTGLGGLAGVPLDGPMPLGGDVGPSSLPQSWLQEAQGGASPESLSLRDTEHGLDSTHLSSHPSSDEIVGLDTTSYIPAGAEEIVLEAAEDEASEYDLSEAEVPEEEVPEGDEGEADEAAEERNVSLSGASFDATGEAETGAGVTAEGAQAVADADVETSVPVNSQPPGAELLPGLQQPDILYAGSQNAASLNATSPESALQDQRSLNFPPRAVEQIMGSGDSHQRPGSDSAQDVDDESAAFLAANAKTEPFAPPQAQSQARAQDAAGPKEDLSPSFLPSSGVLEGLADEEDELESAAEVTSPALILNADPGDLPEPAAPSEAALGLKTAELPPELGWGGAPAWETVSEHAAALAQVLESDALKASVAESEAALTGKAEDPFALGTEASVLDRATHLDMGLDGSGESAGASHMSHSTDVSPIPAWDIPQFEPMEAEDASEEDDIDLSFSPALSATAARFAQKMSELESGTLQALTLDEQFVEALALLKSEATADDASRSNHERAALWLEIGRLHLEKGNQDEALAAFEESTRLYDVFEPGLQALTRLAIAMDQGDKAIDALETQAVATANPLERAGFQARVAQLRARRESPGEKEQALKDLLEAIDAAPGHPWLLSQTLELATAQKSHSVAIQALQGLARSASAPTAALLLVRAGLIAGQSLQDVALSAQLFQRALERYPASVPARMALEAAIPALQEKAEGEAQSVKVWLEQLGAGDEATPSLSMRLRAADRAAMAGDQAKAMSLLQEALDQAPLNPFLRREYQGWLARTGDWDGYLETIRQELQQTDDPTILALLHFIDALVSSTHCLNVPQALKALDAALTLKPHWRVARYEQLRLLATAGEWEKLSQALILLAQNQSVPARAAALYFVAGTLIERHLHTATRHAVEGSTTGEGGAAEWSAPAEGLSHEKLVGYYEEAARRDPQQVIYAWTLRECVVASASPERLDALLESGVSAWPFGSAPVGVNGGAVDSAAVADLELRGALAEFGSRSDTVALGLYQRAFAAGARSSIALGGILRILTRQAHWEALAGVYQGLLVEQESPALRALLLWNLARLTEEKLKRPDEAAALRDELLSLTEFLPARWRTLEQGLTSGDPEAWSEILKGDGLLAFSSQSESLGELEQRESATAGAGDEDVRLETLGEAIYRSRRGLMAPFAGVQEAEASGDKLALDLHESYLFEQGDTKALADLYASRIDKMPDPSGRRFMVQRSAAWREEQGDLQSAYALLLALVAEGVSDPAMLDWLEALAGRLGCDEALNTSLLEIITTPSFGNVSDALRLRVARRLELFGDPTQAQRLHLEVLASRPWRQVSRTLDDAGMESLEAVARLVSLEDLSTARAVSSAPAGQEDAADSGRDAEDGSVDGASERVAGSAAEEASDVFVQTQLLAGDALVALAARRVSGLLAQLPPLEKSAEKGLEKVAEKTPDADGIEDDAAPAVLLRALVLTPEAVLAQAPQGRLAEDAVATAAELSYQAALHYFAAGALAKAELAYRAALRSPVVEVPAFEALLQVYQARGDVAGIEALYAPRIEAETRVVERQCRQMELADQLEALGGVSFATAHFQALAERERCLPAALRLERIYLASEAWEPYVQALEWRAEAVHSSEARAAAKEWVQRVRAERLRDPWALEQSLLATLKADPTREDALDTLRSLLASQERWADLALFLEELVGKEDAVAHKARRLLDLAWIYAHQLDDLDVAFDRYQDVLDLEPENMEALDALREICESREDWNGMVATLARQSLVQSHEQQVETYRTIARLWDEKLGDPLTALFAWQRVLEVVPGDRQALTFQLDLNQRLQRWEPLLEVGEQLLAQRRDEEPTLLIQLGTVAIRELGDLERGVAWLLRAGARGRVEHEVLQEAVQAFEAKGAWREAVELYGRLSRISDSPAAQVECFERSARIYQEKLANPAAAIGAWKEVLRRVPDHLAVMWTIAQLQHELGQNDEAYETLNTLIQEPPAELFLSTLEPSERLRFHRDFGHLCDQVGKKEQAIVQYEQAISLAPDDDEALAALAGLYQSLERWEGYATLLKKLISRQPEVTSEVMQGRLEALAKASIALGDDATVLDACSQLRKLSPSYIPGYRMAAQQLEKRESWSQLLDLYNAMIKHAADLADVVDAYLRKADILDFKLAPENPSYLPKAVRHYVKAVEYDRRNVYAMLRLAEISLKTLQYTQADDWLRRALALEPPPYQRAQTWLLGGILCAEVQQNLERARAIFGKAAELEPGVAARMEALEAAIARSPGNLEGLLKLYHEILPYER